MGNLSKRLRYFRQTKGISQMDLEITTDLAFGSVSRFESGKTNPTKESIYKISEILNLSNSELDYLVGSTSKPANDSEIKQAEKEVESYFNKPLVLAFLIDDRFRLLKVSNTLMSIFDTLDLNQLITLPEILLSKENPIGKFFQKDLNANLEQILIKVKDKMGFMIDDEYYKQITGSILKYSFAKKIWDEILIQNKSSHSIPISNRQFTFGTDKEFTKMHYTIESLEKNPRFSILELYPNMQFYKNFKKFF